MSDLNRGARPWLTRPLLRAYRELRHDPDAAGEVLTRCATQNPDDPQVLALLGGHKFHVGEFDEAATLFSRALSLTGPDKTLYTAIAACCERLSHFEDAIAWRERIAAQFPASPYNAHLLSGLQGKFEVRASAAALRELYDDLAASWDRQYVQDRGFKLATDAYALLTEHGVSLEDPIVLDLGVGTGAVGECFAHTRAAIYGVDVSERMLSIARAKGAYAGLVNADLVEFLARPEQYAVNEAWDLVVALDVFIHFDNIAEIIQSVRRLLGSGSWFLFSVRRDETIAPSTRFTRFGKYVHADHDIFEWITEAGFRHVASRECLIYTWRQYSVRGAMYLAQAE